VVVGVGGVVGAADSAIAAAELAGSSRDRIRLVTPIAIPSTSATNATYNLII
jgi:hypothetical protein